MKVVFICHTQGVLEEELYVYAYVSKDLGVRIPITCFECEFLRVVNVTPSQIHPNDLAFIRSFEFFCKGVGTLPTLKVFFSFNNTRRMRIGTWMSTSAIPQRGRFSMFQSSCKEFMKGFLCVQGSAECTKAMFENNTVFKFPIY